MDPVTKLTLEFAKLPGIGEKTAIRLAYFILKSDDEMVRNFADTLLKTKRSIRFCEECFTFAESTLCKICADPQRKSDILCVVEKPVDLTSIELSQRFHGKYHVLHGVLAPLDGVGPEQIRIRELLLRIEKHLDQVQEVILALNPSVEGEATSVYLTKLLKPLGIKISKIAHGIPVGGVLEYTDRQTIGRALENRITNT